MNTDMFFRWFPLVVSIIQLAFLPLVVIALNAQIDSRIERHNDNMYAHPGLVDLRKLEDRLGELAENVKSLELAIARMTPRRSTDSNIFPQQTR